jgi:hypothetical protein
MKLILIGALQLFGGWFVISALLIWFFQLHPAVQGSAAIGISIFGGLLIWAALALIVSSLARLRERATILRGIEAVPPKDGKRSMIVGRIESMGEVLQAPLDGGPLRCVQLRDTH